MKKLKTLFFILFLILLALTLTGCSNKDSNKEKAVSEVKYLENKLVSLLNSMNNVQYENYKITTTKIEDESTSDSNKSTDKSDSSNSNGGSEGSMQKEQQSGEQSSSEKNQSQSEGESQSQNDNKYALQKTSMLTNKNNTIDWEKTKNEVEEMYSSIPTITLDLYSQNVNQSEILNFNNELDNLTVAVKDENKEQTLAHLSNLYGYLPGYLELVSTDSTYTNLIRTKTNVINAYSLIDTGDWNKISVLIKQAISSYSNILNNIDDESKSYSINKGYILLNELQNAVNLKDKDIFLIKYKNLLEEFNSI